MSKHSLGLKDKRKSSKPSYKLRDLETSYSFVRHMNSHIVKGMSLERSFMHWGLQQFEVQEPTIDYGSGSNKPKYYQFFSNQVSDVTLTDLYIEGEGITKLNLEKTFSLKKKYTSFVCLNVLEHIFNSQQLLDSAAEHLEKNGYGIISTPYLYQYHPSPYDFWRYSPEAIQSMSDRAGLTMTEVVYLGKGPFVASVAMIWNVLPTVFRFIFFWIAWGLDSLLLRFSSMFTHNYALGYIFKVEK